MKCVNVTVAKIKLMDYYTMWFDSTLQEIHVEQTDHYNLVYKGSRITTIKPYLEAYIECPFGAFDKTSEVLENCGMIKYDIVAGNC
uniref:Uncharacterized protein n=1 Tax=Panagrolaimus sp. PS1159 TaxID=55785 RepID=A0AC35G4Y1_9BILA